MKLIPILVSLIVLFDYGYFSRVPLNEVQKKDNFFGDGHFHDAQCQSKPSFKVEPVLWNSAKNETIGINFTFETSNLQVLGQLASIELKSDNDIDLILSLFFDDGSLHARFGPKNDHRQMHWILITNTAAGKKHSVSFEFRPNRVMRIFMDTNFEKLYSFDHYFIIKNTLNQEMITISTIFGHFSDLSTESRDQSFNGCVSNVKIWRKNGPGPIQELQSVISSRKLCFPYCSSQNKKIVKFSGNSVIKYEFAKYLDESRDFVQNLEFAFKTTTKAEQILFNGFIIGSEKDFINFTIFLTKYGQIFFTTFHTKSLYENGDHLNYADGRWHTILCKFDFGRNAIIFKVDHYLELETGFYFTEKLPSFSYPVILNFGGPAQKLGENEPKNENDGQIFNFVGCMKNIAINNDEILTSEKSKKVLNMDQLNFGSCSSDQLTKSQSSFLDGYQKDEPIFPKLMDGQLGSKLQESKLVEKGQNGDHYDPHLQPPIEIATHSEEATPHHVIMYSPALPLIVEDMVSPTGQDSIEKSISGHDSSTGITASVEVQPIIKHCDSFTCYNGATCVENKCKCRKGFIGKQCQFSTLPRNCHEIYLKNGENHDELKPGVYQIDPQGTFYENESSNDMEIYANCQWDRKKEEAHTIIGHNFPPKTSVSYQSLSRLSYTVRYRFLNAAGLRKLINNSEKCEQSITYECTKAPFLLSKNTWFQSASVHENFSLVGDEEDGCPSSTNFRKRRSPVSANSNGGGKSHVTCNCDSNESVERSDVGKVSGKYAAITKMTFGQNSTNLDSMTRLTLGDLKCTGSRNEIQIRKSSVSLKLPIWKVRQLSFWFKTSQSNVDILRQKHSTNDNRYFEISIRDGHILDIDFKFDGYEANKIELESTQVQLNDSIWRRIVVERMGGEILFSLNDQHAFYQLTAVEQANLEQPDYFDMPLILGNFDTSTSQGYIGCLRQFIEDEVSINFPDFTANLTRSDIAHHCQAICTPKFTCQNGGICIEDYAEENYICQCPKKFPITISGPNCQIDLNKDSDVTLFNPRHSFISITNFLENPLVRDTLLSFRTDQPDALLIYAHDQRYNMLQVHLSGGNKITLILNYRKSLRTCTIFNAEKEFNKMDWIQLLIAYSSDHVTLYADSLSCKVEGGVDYSLEYIDQWDNAADIENVVIPPRSPFLPKDLSKVEENTILFIGGVPNLGVLNQGERRRKRQAMYNTAVPNLLGALRGLNIGNATANLRNFVKSSDKYVQAGSQFDCSHLECKNGGYCSINWHKTDRPARCNCFETSFSGSSCSDGTSINFEGHSFISYDMETFLGRNALPSKRSYDLFTLAFFAKKPEINKENLKPQQLLAEFKFKDDHILSLLLNEDCLRIALKFPNHNHSFNFTGNFLDGYRHLVLIRFWKDELLFRVDNDQNYRWTTPDENFMLDHLNTAFFGGSFETKNSVITRNLIGYLSQDTMFHFYTGKHPVVVRPLKDPQDSSKSPHTVVQWENGTRKGLAVALSPGASFKPAPIVDTVTPRSIIEPVTAPYWDVPLQTEVVHLSTEPGTTIVQIPDKGNKTSLIIGLVLFIILLILLVAVILLYKYCSNRNGPRRLPPSSDLTLTPEDLRKRKQPEGIENSNNEKEPLVKSQPFQTSKTPELEKSPRNQNSHPMRVLSLTPNQGTIPDPDKDLGASEQNGVRPRLRSPPAKSTYCSFDDDFAKFPPPPTDLELKDMRPPVPPKPKFLTKYETLAEKLPPPSQGPVPIKLKTIKETSRQSRPAILKI